MTTSSIEFQLNEETRRSIDQVRAMLGMMATMGLSGTDDSCTDISKNDLIGVLSLAEEKLKIALDGMVQIRH